MLLPFFGFYSIFILLSEFYYFYIADYLLTSSPVADPYMCMADFESYRMTHARAVADYADKEKWNRMSLMNIAASGFFAADRSIKEYADNIWNIKPLIK